MSALAALRAWWHRRREPDVLATAVLPKDWADMTPAEREAFIDSLMAQLYPDRER